MTLFLSAVLAAAAFQSFCKLALLPRRWEFLTAVLLLPLPFLFEDRIAQTSLAAVTASLSGAAALENWCALVVIQELFSLLAGFSLLSEYESGEGRLRRWKFAAFLPSVLLPAGALYLQMRLFNGLPGMEFRHITWILAAALPAGTVPVCIGEETAKEVIKRGYAPVVAAECTAAALADAVARTEISCRD